MLDCFNDLSIYHHNVQRLGCSTFVGTIYYTNLSDIRFTFCLGFKGSMPTGVLQVLKMKAPTNTSMTWEMEHILPGIS